MVHGASILMVTVTDNEKVLLSQQCGVPTQVAYLVLEWSNVSTVMLSGYPTAVISRILVYTASHGENNGVMKCPLKSLVSC